MAAASISNNPNNQSKTDIESLLIKPNNNNINSFLIGKYIKNHEKMQDFIKKSKIPSVVTAEAGISDTESQAGGAKSSAVPVPSEEIGSDYVEIENPPVMPYAINLADVSSTPEGITMKKLDDFYDIKKLYASSGDENIWNSYFRQISDDLPRNQIFILKKNTENPNTHDIKS